MNKVDSSSTADLVEELQSDVQISRSRPSLRQQGSVVWKNLKQKGKKRVGKSVCNKLSRALGFGGWRRGS